ncbi:hypothetical protein QBC37DRAFT_417190 [Rhypophila decipiens]|uniref:t-SNARE coiled-coil homology domain-containing protein n=1 Tax=Rhypophila decipiens TaxID=261697 RepID=A0AAN6YD02_9PEZI|nr:hypothetical protein QBC37DRAFT_417190 [Rhypophila decipiens]
MASRFNGLHQRDSRNDLFKGYTGSNADSASRRITHNTSPGQSGRLNGPGGGGYGYSGGAGGYGYPAGSSHSPAAGLAGPSSYGGGGGGAGYGQSHLGVGGQGGFRPATPNRKGQYSDAVLNELESQNDSQVEGILGKVKVLKDMTIAIGDEIRDSSALAEKMNEGFDQTRLRLRGTMNRMLVMAERTGVGWKVWLGFFALVIFLFTYVWLF